jgi:hypothetical protein
MEPKNTKISFIKQSILGIATAITLWIGSTVRAATNIQENIEEVRPDGIPRDLVGPSGLLTSITEKILLAVGVISVFMLIYGGLRYITSGGDSKKVTDAKNTILYAIVGLIVAILAFAIVRFVLNSLGVSDENIVIE